MTKIMDCEGTVNSLIEVVLIDVAEILFSIAFSWIYFIKIYLGKKLYSKGRKGAWFGLGFYGNFFLMVPILFFEKKYISPNDFYDSRIHFLLFAGMIVSMLISGVLGIYALKARASIY